MSNPCISYNKCCVQLYCSRNIFYYNCTNRNSFIKEIPKLLLLNTKPYAVTKVTCLTVTAVRSFTSPVYPHTNTPTHTHTVCSRHSGCGWRSHASTPPTSISGDFPLSTTPTDSRLSSRHSAWVADQDSIIITVLITRDNNIYYYFRI